MAVRVFSSPTLSRPFVELFCKMLDFSTKWPTKFLDVAIIDQYERNNLSPERMDIELPKRSADETRVRRVIDSPSHE